MAARASESTPAVNNDDKPLVLVPVSGGFDSALALTLAVEDESVDVIAVHFRYRNTHEGVAAAEEASLMKLLGNLNTVFERDAVQELIFEDLPMEKADDDVWPARNMIMLAVCVGLAQSRGADYIYFANLPSADMADGDPHFVDALNVASNIAYPGIHIEQTLIERFGRFSDFYQTKADVLDDLDEIGVLTTQLWSCFDPVNVGGEWKHCGKCAGCMTLKHANRVMTLKHANRVGGITRLLPEFVDDTPAPEPEEDED